MNVKVIIYFYQYQKHYAMLSLSRRLSISCLSRRTQETIYEIFTTRIRLMCDLVVSSVHRRKFHKLLNCTMQTAVKILFYSFGLLHHVYTTVYIRTQVDFSQGKNQRIMDMYIYNNRYLTSWNMGLQILYFTLALIHECLLLNKSFVASRLSEILHRIRGYFFTSLVAPCTLVVASFFWTFYHVDKNYMVPLGADDIIPAWINHSIHTNILFLPIVEIFLPKMYTPTFWNSFLAITFFSTVYDAMFLFTYFDTGKWMYPLYDQISWPTRIMLLGVMYAASLVFCRLVIIIQNMKTDTGELGKRRNYKKSVACVTKKLL